MSSARMLQRWQQDNVIDAATAARIAAYERARGQGRFSRAVIGLGALAMLLGLAAIIGANWQTIPAAVKLGGHILLNVGLGVALARTEGGVVREVLTFLLMGATLTFLALIGQIYQTQAPLWQSMGLWLLIVTPFAMISARHRVTIMAWCLGMYVALGSFIEPVIEWLGYTKLPIAFFSIVPFILIGAGQSLWLRRYLQEWAEGWAIWGTFSVVLYASLIQLLWSMHSNLTAHETSMVAVGVIAALLAAGGVMAARRQGWLLARPVAYDCVLLIGVVLSGLPALIGHEEWPVIGAILLIGYWFVIGWFALQSERPGLFNLSVIIIALRLLAVYIEVFGSLLQTGFGLIISGAVLIFLVQGSRSIIRRFKPGAEPAVPGKKDPSITGASA